jgi:hypothetical protein
MVGMITLNTQAGLLQVLTSLSIEVPVNTLILVPSFFPLKLPRVLISRRKSLKTAKDFSYAILEEGLKYQLLLIVPSSMSASYQRA